MQHLIDKKFEEMTARFESMLTKKIDEQENKFKEKIDAAQKEFKELQDDYMGKPY